MNLNISVVVVADSGDNQDLLKTVGLVPFILLTFYDFIMLFLGKIQDHIALMFLKSN